MKKSKGTVTWFNDAKGYGLITDDDTPDKPGQVFVHYTYIVGDGFRTLTEDQRVSFERVDGPKGPIAFNCEKIKE